MAERRSVEEITAELRRLEQSTGDHPDRSMLLHELQVYQEELTIQNDALREAQSALQESRDRFVELYDFAPNGYVTLDEGGVILQINLTGAAWLGRSQQALEGVAFSAFVAPNQGDRWLDYLRRCASHRDAVPVSCELMLRAADGPRYVELMCRPRRTEARAREYMTAIIDVNEQRRVRLEREAQSEARAALARRLISIQEEERLRLARDLHDNVGQELSALRLRLEAMAMRTSSATGDTRAREALAIVDRLDRSLDFVVAGLRPPSIDLSLVSALQHFVDEWSETFGVSATLHAADLGSGRMQLAGGETHIYRIVQEALHNVHKHAGATRVHIGLVRRGRELLLRIEDNGRGLGPRVRPTHRRHGFGIPGMRERTSLLGGELKLDSTPGNGTTITVSVPQAFATDGSPA